MSAGTTSSAEAAPTVRGGRATVSWRVWSAGSFGMTLA